MAEVAASFITDPDKYAVCSLAGIPTFSGKIVEFEKIAAALRNQLPELEKEKSRAGWAKRGLFAAQLVKAACDGFIATADAIVDSKATNAIAAGYGLATDVAGTTSAALNTGVSGADLAKVALNRAAEAAKHRIPGASELKEAGDALTDVVKNSSTMVIDAANKNEDETINGLVSTTAAMGKLAATGAKDRFTKMGLKRFFGAGEAIINTARNFAKSYREMNENDDEKMFENLKKSLNQQIRMFELKIAELHRAIYEYENQRASRLPSPMAAPKPPMPHATKHR